MITKEVVLTVSKGIVKIGLPMVSFALSTYLENQRITDKVNKIVAETLKNTGTVIQKVEP